MISSSVEHKVGCKLHNHLSFFPTLGRGRTLLLLRDRHLTWDGEQLGTRKVIVSHFKGRNGGGGAQQTRKLAVVRSESARRRKRVWIWIIARRAEIATKVMWSCALQMLGLQRLQEVLVLSQKCLLHTHTTASTPPQLNTKHFKNLKHLSENVLILK